MSLNIDLLDKKRAKIITWIALVVSVFILIFAPIFPNLFIFKWIQQYGGIVVTGSSLSIIIGIIVTIIKDFMIKLFDARKYENQYKALKKENEALKKEIKDLKNAQNGSKNTNKN